MSKTETAPQQAEKDVIGRDSLSDKIYEILRFALMTGRFEPGARLNIRSIAADYEISPTPVREAVFQLVREGALEIRLGHQPRVPVLTLPHYINIRETRVPLERLAAELAAARISGEDIERLKLLDARFRQSEANEQWKEALAANQDFHFTIFRAAGNSVLLQCIENLWLIAGPFVNNQYPIHRPETGQQSIHEHIIDALERRSPVEAGEWMVRDLREGSNLILEKLKAEGYEVEEIKRKAERKSRLSRSR